MSENLRPPLHVAQQSRRDKLRIQQTSIQPQKDLLNVNNILYDPMIYASEMVNFLPSNTEDSSSLRSFPRSQESCDWAVGLDMDRNQNTVFVEEIASSTIYSKHNFNTIHESMNTNSTGITTHDCASKHFSEVYGNGIVVHTSMGESGWLGVGNGREFLPGYVNQASDISNNWSRSRGRMGGCDSGGWGGNKSTACDSNVVHGLSLSLSSNQWGCMNNEEQQQKPVTVCLNSLDDIVGRTSAISAHTVVAGPLGPFTGYATILKSSKFLGPTQELLEEFCDLVGCKNRKERSSDDGKGENVEEEDDDEYESSCCVATNGESVEGGGGSSSSRVGNSSSSGFCCQPEFHQKKATLLCLQEEVGFFYLPTRPLMLILFHPLSKIEDKDTHTHKEVCRRFRQYQQQMKMVVSSFESVAGLSAATPYISQALKTVSCYFRRIKYAISDQLKHAKKALEEEMDIQAASAPAAGINGEELPPHILSPKLLHHKPKLGFPDPHHHHIWRPQRGLPERSVAILRAWLFDHFLHPYPTDTDKHMLATQTGLSRNQVSNWFINARVRVWKPMVEEIHMLETKGAVSEMGTDSRRNETKGSNRTKHTGVCNMGVAGENEYLGDTPMLETQAMVCGMEESGQQHTQDKRARVDRPLPEAMSAPLVEFSPYHHGRMEFGGIGAVSLTLGLRNNVEGVTQHQQQFLQRGHFAGQMIRDFVG